MGIYLQGASFRFILFAFWVLLPLSSLSAKPFVGSSCAQLFLNKKLGYIPIVRQQTSYTCGPAAALSWLRSIGVQGATEESLAVLMKTNSHVGTLANNMVRGFLKLGIRAKKQTGLQYQDLSDYMSRGYGVLVLIKAGLEDHWLLVTQVQPHQVMVMDPWYLTEGFVMISKRKFLNIWTGHQGFRLAVVAKPVRLR